MSKHIILLSSFLLVIILQAKDNKPGHTSTIINKYGPGDEKFINENSTRPLASFTLKYGIKEERVKIDSSEEISFQNFFKATQGYSPKSITCESVDEGNGKTHLELSFPSKKLGGNGTFYAIDAAQWKDEFNKGEIIGSSLQERREKVLHSFNSVKDSTKTATPGIIVKIKYNGDTKGNSTLTPFSKLDYERRDGSVVSSQYYRQGKDAIGSPLPISLSQKDIENICKALQRFKDSSSQTKNAESNSASIYNVDFSGPKGEEFFSEMKFSTQQTNETVQAAKQLPAPKKTKK
jgi:hypothetical protein